MKSFAPILLIALLATPSLYSQTDEEYLRSAIDELISTSGAGGVFSDFPTKILDLCTQYTGGKFSPDRKLQRLATTYLAQDRLVEHLKEELFKRSGRAELEALLAWHKSDWYRETKSMLDAEREESYREFRQRTEGDTLAAERAELIRRFIAANDVGPYFLGIMEAEHDAIRAFGAVLGHEILGDLPYFTEEQRETVRKDSEKRMYQ